MADWRHRRNIVELKWNISKLNLRPQTKGEYTELSERYTECRNLVPRVARYKGSIIGYREILMLRLTP